MVTAKAKAIAGWTSMESDPSINPAGYGCRPLQSGRFVGSFLLALPFPNGSAFMVSRPEMQTEEHLQFDLGSDQPDTAEPWLTQYRFSIADHPGSSISRF